ncbi:precorrin-8X methylmutase [Chloroflexota bacterium]
MLTIPCLLIEARDFYIGRQKSVHAAGLGHNFNDIEARSMVKIEELLPGLEYSGQERQVIKRIVHATGDIGIARLVRFHPDAVACGVAAIRAGRPIFTDVRMVVAGLNRHLTRQFGCSVHCALDESKVMKQAVDGNDTRSATAFRSLNTRLNNAMVAIGNAPTALLALVNLIDKGVAPSLVVGMPVGFIQAKESKTELTKRSVPYIVITGRRGGSPAAAATMNALLLLALEA